MKSPKLINLIIYFVIILLLLPVLGVHAAEEEEPVQDLVKNRPVTVSSETAANPGALAVDGNGNTYWRVNETQGDVWLTVDLGGPTTFNHFVISGYGYPNLSGFKIQVSDDGQSWTDVFVKTGGIVDSLETGYFDDTTARYVRYLAVRKTNTVWVGLRSFELYRVNTGGMLNEINVDPVGFRVTKPARSIYDVIIPEGIDQTTVAVVPFSSNQTIELNGTAGTEFMADLSETDEVKVEIKVSTTAGDLKTYLLYVKRAPLANGAYTLSYEDHFTGNALRVTDWVYRTGERLGGFNLPENVRVGPDEEGNSNLHILYKHEDLDGSGTKKYTGGGIISRHNFGYGYYEVRAKLFGENMGLHQSFWSMGYGNTEDVEAKRLPVYNQVIEIDGFEVDSGSPDILSMNRHFYVPEHLMPPGAKKIELDTTNWFVMGYEWLPGRVNFYVNGDYVHTIYIDELYAPQNVWLTALATPDAFGGAEPPVDGASAQFDYFRYYSLPLKEVNLVANDGFEYNMNTKPLQYPVSWIERGDETNSSVTLDTYGGGAVLEHAGDSGYQVSTMQRMEYIPNGTYSIRTKVRSSGGQPEAHIRISTGGGIQYVLPIPETDEWTEIELQDVEVFGNQAELSIESAAAGGQWLQADDLTFEWEGPVGLNRLQQLVDTYVDHAGIRRSLKAKLNDATPSQTKDLQLQAFINEAAALRGVKLEARYADILSAYARQIISGHR